MWFVGAAVIAIILHLYYEYARKRAKMSEGKYSKRTIAGALMGRESTLNNFIDRPQHFTRRVTIKEDEESHDERETNDVLFATTGDPAVTIATDSIALDDTVQVDRSPEHQGGCFHENKSPTSFGSSLEEIVDTDLLSDTGGVAGLSRLEKKMDEFIHCYQRVKMQIETS